jgi:alkanesulfonate monooxygenase SsuD/methylene tetrahydromethanopterin reductase-like flavin-dependent oxidoreductase (luciferase family)
MPRISIAMSGGPNPAEIIDLVVLAECLGYASAWVAEGMAAGSAIHVMLALCRRSRQVVVADEELNGPDMVGELLGKGQRVADQP